MFSKSSIYYLFIIIIPALILAACGGTEAAPTTIPVQEERTNTAPEKSPEGMRTFVIVPGESQASYQVDEEFLEDALGKLGINAGLSDVVGITQAVEGQLQINPNDMTGALGENSFTVDMRTLKTDQDRRDNYILDKGPAFNRFPEATFNATDISGLPAEYVDGEEIQFQLSGMLTVHDVAVPVTFAVNAILDGDTLTGVAETRQLMSDFGIEPPNFARTLTVADEFGIRVEFTAKEN